MPYKIMMYLVAVVPLVFLAAFLQFQNFLFYSPTPMLKA